MGTQKQADTIVDLMKRGKKLGTLPNGTTIPMDKHEAGIREMVLKASQQEVVALFAKLNKNLGFDKKINGATESQLKYIRDLENKIYGTVISVPTTERLTYEDADLRIRRLKLELAETQVLQASAVGNLI